MALEYMTCLFLIHANIVRYFERPINATQYICTTARPSPRVHPYTVRIVPGLFLLWQGRSPFFSCSVSHGGSAFSQAFFSVPPPRWTDLQTFYFLANSKGGFIFCFGTFLIWYCRGAISQFGLPHLMLSSLLSPPVISSQIYPYMVTCCSIMRYPPLSEHRQKYLDSPLHILQWYNEISHHLVNWLLLIMIYIVISLVSRLRYRIRQCSTLQRNRKGTMWGLLVYATPRLFQSQVSCCCRLPETGLILFVLCLIHIRVKSHKNSTNNWNQLPYPLNLVSMIIATLFDLLKF